LSEQPPTISDFNCNRQQSFEFHRPTHDGLFQSLAIEIPHGDEGFDSIFTNVINCADTRVIQRPSGFGLTPKSL